MASRDQTQSRVSKPEEMFPLIEEWEGSDLSQTAFCAQRGLKPHVFWYWLRRYRQTQQSPKKAINGFIAVEVESSQDEAILAEIIYADGTRLLFKERVGLAVLRGLLPKV